MGLKNSVGSITSSNLAPRPVAPMAGFYGADSITIGQIVEVLPIKHPNNRSQRAIEYTVEIEDNNRSISTCTNCVALDAFGAINDFQEVILPPTTTNPKEYTTAYRNGATVVVAFLSGTKERGVILGGIQHPFINLESPATPVAPFEGEGSSTSRDEALTQLPTLLPGATEQGPTTDTRILGEFNGVRWNINKDGELTIIFQGLKDDQGQLVTPDSQPTIIKITKDGEFLVLDNLDQEIKISRKDQKIIISDGQKEQPNIITLDRANNKITVQSPSKIEVVAPAVRVGSATANQQAVLGNLFMTLFNKLVSNYNRHFHTCPHGGVTSSPGAQAKNMTQEQLSKNVKISPDAE